jgi:hypothetical protein
VEKREEGAAVGVPAASSGSYPSVVETPSPQSEATIKTEAEQQGSSTLTSTPKSLCPAVNESSCSAVNEVEEGGKQAPETMRQTSQEANGNHVAGASPTPDHDPARPAHNNKVLTKSDSGFSEQHVSEGPRNRKPDGVKAIYKSDSGYSEHGGSDDDNVGVRSKQISVSEAHTLFNRRYAAMLLQEQEGVPLTAASTKAANVIREDSEDGSESDDADDSDEDSVVDPKGRGSLSPGGSVAG